MKKFASDSVGKNEILDDILNHEGDGHIKYASALTSKATRTTVYEEGFQRAIMPFEDITNADLDYFGDSEESGVWFELEADAPPCRSVPYNSTPHTFMYSAVKYVVMISPIISEEATKNINELRNYKTDVRTIVQDNLIRGFPIAEDTAFIVQVDRICDTAVDCTTGSFTTETQHASGLKFDRDGLARAMSFLTDRERPLPIGSFLINQRTANEFLRWKREDVGGDLSQELLKDGLKALKQFSVMGVPYICTIKKDLVPNGVMYQFTTNDFMGHALRLEDIRVTIEKKHDIIRMRADEQIGLTFGNTKGLQKVSFELP